LIFLESLLATWNVCAEFKVSTFHFNFWFKHFEVAKSSPSLMVDQEKKIQRSNLFLSIHLITISLIISKKKFVKISFSSKLIFCETKLLKHKFKLCRRIWRKRISMMIEFSRKTKFWKTSDDKIFWRKNFPPSSGIKSPLFFFFE
jgi:hypothetical protein